MFTFQVNIDYIRCIGNFLKQHRVRSRPGVVNRCAPGMCLSEDFRASLITMLLPRRRDGHRGQPALSNHVPRTSQNFEIFHAPLHASRTAAYFPFANSFSLLLYTDPRFRHFNSKVAVYVSVGYISALCHTSVCLASVIPDVGLWVYYGDALVL